MRYYLHILTDKGLISDPDGEEFPDIDAARVEAEHSARALMASELAAGRSLSPSWCIQIANARGVVITNLRFDDIIHRAGPPVPDNMLAKVPELISDARAAVLESRGIREEMRKTRQRTHAELRTLSRLVMALSKQGTA